ncbi:restriction endonuclease subunit S [Algoriphagus chordae]|uniref:Type I restriction enzyme S subunit n=1 Tax=Algoriphagus chordae TaxID=237019 RepID=A0A2W7QNN6_9BACT|nr:restriction endonuclease subunit S [Algoriphagus chordae]PZX50128.1 type I restriction enzyme S subunit [Algoriphagus chordae]
MRNEKRTAPGLRFPEFTTPWNVKTLSEEIQIFNGYAFQSSNSQDTGCRWIKIADVGINKISNTNMSYLPPSFSAKYKKFLLKEGDVVIALTRPILSGKLKIAKIDQGSNNSLLNQRVGKLISLGSLDYAYQLFQRRSLIGRIENNIAGTDPPNLAPSDLSSFKILFPSLPEQQRIAEFLTAVDKRIELLEQKKEKLEAYKKGVMQQLFPSAGSGQVPKIRFKQDNGSDFPDWEEKKLGEVYEFRTTNSFSRDKLNYESGKFRNIHYGDIHTKFHTLLDLERVDLPFVNNDVAIRKTVSENLVEAGDLVIADASEDYADIGKTIEIVNVNGQKVLAGLHTLHAKRKQETTEVGFGGYIMKSDGLRSQIMKIAQGTKVLSISVPRMRELDVKLPTPGEQNKIVKFLTSLDSSIENMDQQINQTQTWKKGLLQKMFF